MLGYDYHGNMAVLLDDFRSESREGWTKLMANILKNCRVSKVLGFGGFDGDEWRRWVAGVLTQRALTWKSLYVTSGEKDMHSCSLIFLPDSEQTCSSFRPCRGTNFASVAEQSVWQIHPTCVSLLRCRGLVFVTVV